MVFINTKSQITSRANMFNITLIIIITIMMIYRNPEDSQITNSSTVRNLKSHITQNLIHVQKDNRKSYKRTT